MNKRLQQLQDRAAEIVREQKALNDRLAEDDRLEFTEEEQAKFDALSEEFDKTCTAIDRENAIIAAEQRLSPREEQRRDEERARREEQNGRRPPEEEGQRARDDEPPRFESFGQYLQAVARAGMNPHEVDQRLIPSAAASGLNEAVGSEGGFLVEAETTSEILKAIYETGQLSRRCRRTPIGPGKNGLKLNGIDETSRADGSQWGGVIAYWESEAAEKTASKPKFRKVELDLHKLIGLCYATDELLDDAVALEAVVREAFPNVFAFKVDDGIVRGTGAGQLKGILTGAVNAPRIRITKEVGQAATTIVAENIEKMYSRQWARGVGNAVWLVNQDCWPQIFQLHHVIGMGGVPMFVPAGGLNQSPFGTLLGRPIVPTEQCATLGTEGDIIFADLSQYMLIDKGGIQSASSIHVRFIYDETTFRFVLRVDGQPMWASSLTPAQGSNTVSPFITLAARA